MAYARLQRLGTLPMPGRTAQYSWSRHGYNGQAKDDEVYGPGNLNTALHWEYDTRIGPNGRWNTDPVVNPSVSPYATFEGNPIWKNDVLGNSPNTYEVDYKAGTTKKLDNNGGDKTDYIVAKNIPLGGGQYLNAPLNSKPMEVPVVRNVEGTGMGEQKEIARGPGFQVMSSLPSGRADFVDDPITGLGPSLVRGGLKMAARKLVSASAASAKEAPDAVRVFRAAGGTSPEFGESWTTINPTTIPNYRQVAGLPNSNTAEKLIEGMVNWKDVKHIRPGLPLDGNPGGIPELIIKNASYKIISPIITPLKNPL